MPNFVFIAAGLELANLGYRFRENLAFPASFTVVEIKMEDAVDYCKHKLPETIDAVIARGNTANMLRAAHIPVPVVTLPIKDFELIRSINAACALYPDQKSRIAYIGLQDFISSVSEFIKMIHKDIRFFQIKDSRDIQNCIRQAKQEHIQVVIGGEYTKEVAEAHGLRCVLLESTESSLKEAYEQALEIQKGILLQKKKFQEKLIMMNAISDGIIGVNEKGRINIFNKAAATLFSKKEAQVIGKSASSLFNGEELAIINRTLLRGDEILAHPAVLSEQHCLLDFRPVIISGQSKGVIIRICNDSGSSAAYLQKSSVLPNMSGFYNGLDEPSGQSQAFLSACALSSRFAASSFPVLITGESGTEKTAFAYQIHRKSHRKDQVFLVREGALLTPEDFMSSNGGSLCIHDVNTLSPTMYSILNQYLEQGILSMSNQSFCQLDIRIFATLSVPSPDNAFVHKQHMSDFQNFNMNPHLEQRLYYNLNALTLHLPPLRERPEDIWPLFTSMLETLCKANAANIPILPEDAATKLLSEYHWFGNAYELKSIVRRFALMVSESRRAEDNLHVLQQCLASESQVQQNHVLFGQTDPATTSVSPSRKFENKNVHTEISAETLTSDKNFMIHGRLVSWNELKALDQYYQGHRSLLAKQLGVSRSTLWRYFKEMES